MTWVVWCLADSDPAQNLLNAPNPAELLLRDDSLNNFIFMSLDVEAKVLECKIAWKRLQNLLLLESGKSRLFLRLCSGWLGRSSNLLCNADLRFLLLLSSAAHFHALASIDFNSSFLSATIHEEFKDFKNRILILMGCILVEQIAAFLLEHLFMVQFKTCGFESVRPLVVGLIFRYDLSRK